ncbi:RNA polymerase sigma factor [Embleya sp. NPDC056575]|uniref:RNA polymerase sigma factor n=1 Tax=unclassified Embleya TaxID=2699296 RepID=UPI0036AF2E9B
MTEETAGGMPAAVGGASVEGFERRLALSFEAFHDVRSRPWHEYAHLELGGRRAAEEAVRAAFRELRDAWPRVLESPSVEAHAWALLKEHVARRRSRGRGRKTVLVQTAAFMLAQGRPWLEELGALEHSIGLYTAIARLPERQYDVVMLRYVLEYPDDKVAHLTGMPRATVRSNVRWAKRTLARELGIDHSEPEGG